ncbi:helix-turn-helix domain-containing protein [Neisseria lisongii]|uniref:Helix-turn-helix transcriptional regulator n=1 Tax=Neisseria lisongii TaxID=2912188 RepID=A0AAW5AQP1_9NEIS|nr:helix-turn-helix transcriptional regulator [Neisseria lisongii]MCF7530585.1 helix-turn-helix transcriptional regulator [Neisseria lisongii]
MVQLSSDLVDQKIGKRIQLKRKEQGYSADKLSELIGISQQQLSRYERGVNKINVGHLIAIANFLHTPISWFFLDCVVEKEDDLNEWDQKWHKLNDEQKQNFVNFLESLNIN